LLLPSLGGAPLQFSVPHLAARSRPPAAASLRRSLAGCSARCGPFIFFFSFACPRGQARNMSYAALSPSRWQG
jgi:hypothetical protein